MVYDHFIASVTRHFSFCITTHCVQFPWKLLFLINVYFRFCNQLKTTPFIIVNINFYFCLLSTWYVWNDVEKCFVTTKWNLDSPLPVLSNHTFFKLHRVQDVFRCIYLHHRWVNLSKFENRCYTANVAKNADPRRKEIISRKNLFCTFTTWLKLICCVWDCFNYHSIASKISMFNDCCYYYNS